MHKSVIAVASAASVLLAGCSVSAAGHGTPSSTSDNSTLAAGDASAAIRAALLAEPTFRIHDTSSDTDGVPIRIDIHFGTNGASGTITEGADTLELLGVGSDVYLKASDSFWQAELYGVPNSAAVLKGVSGKYVKVPSGNPEFTFDVATLVDKQKFLDQTMSNDPLTLIGPQKFQGMDAIAYKASSDGTTIYIQAHGKPLPIGTVGNQATNPDTATFDSYGDAFTVSEPPANQIYDLTTVLH